MPFVNTFNDRHEHVCAIFSHPGPTQCQGHGMTFLFVMSDYGREHMDFILVCVPSIRTLFLNSVIVFSAAQCRYCWYR